MNAPEKADSRKYTLDLTGCRAVVTGATRGLGHEIACALELLGASVIGTSRTDEGADIIKRSTAGRIDTATLDVTSVSSLARSVDDILDRLGGVDILVNNAGVNAPAAALDVEEQDWDNVLNTNLKGTFFLTQAFARRWIAHNQPATVINIGSQAGSVGIEERAAYCSSKGGLNLLTKVLAIEWAPHGIRVNTVAPTFVLTELTATTLARAEWRDTLLSRIPLGRFGEPSDVAGAVAFLASNAAAMITGQTLLVDGGYTAR